MNFFGHLDPSLSPLGQYEIASDKSCQDPPDAPNRRGQRYKSHRRTQYKTGNPKSPQGSTHAPMYTMPLRGRFVLESPRIPQVVERVDQPRRERQQKIGCPRKFNSGNVRGEPRHAGCSKADVQAQERNPSPKPNWIKHAIHKYNHTTSSAKPRRRDAKKVEFLTHDVNCCTRPE